MTTIGQVTHYPCPSAPEGDSHHLIPRSGVMTCVYCERTATDIEASHRDVIDRMAKLRSLAGVKPVSNGCGATGCDHQFEPGEMRYRAADGKSYCVANGHGQAMWAAEQGATS